MTAQRRRRARISLLAALTPPSRCLSADLRRQPMEERRSDFNRIIDGIEDGFIVKIN